jgi:hypothetical protein
MAEIDARLILLLVAEVKERRQPFQNAIQRAQASEQTDGSCAGLPLPRACLGKLVFQF